MARGLEITPEVRGAERHAAVDYPIRYGRYAQIEIPEYRLQFDLDGSIRHLQGRPESGWPAAEWLKRSLGDDWIYYSAGDYQGVFDLYGEHYIPCPSYPANAIFGGRPFRRPALRRAVAGWHAALAATAERASAGLRADQRGVLERVLALDAAALAERARALVDIIGCSISVIPPESRQVDYDLLPLVIADGCLYRCAFCRVKTGADFAPRSRRDIRRQIEQLGKALGPALRNRNAVFLGQHDALAVEPGHLLFAAEAALRGFALDRSHLRGAHLFFFASVDSLLAASPQLFEQLDALGCRSWINVGLESADAPTLRRLGKPLATAAVAEAFHKLVEVNRRFEHIELSANFVWSPELPRAHTDALIELTRDALAHFYSKGAIYLSPLLDDRGPRPERRAVLRAIREIQLGARMPVYLYLIQRLLPPQQEILPSPFPRNPRPGGGC